jgi:D-3-phosphoglycerate dehydrogenase
VARSVRLALEGDFVPDAVNVQAGGSSPRSCGPALPLVEKLGRVFTALAGGVAGERRSRVSRGGSPSSDVSVLQLAPSWACFADVVEEQVTSVNAPALAGRAGLGCREQAPRRAPTTATSVRVHGVLPHRRAVLVSGTLTGPRQVEKLVEVDGFDIELLAEKHLVFPPATHDRPGVVGVVGARLGDAGVNIAGAQVSRTARGGEALMALTVDSTPPHEVLEQLAREIGAHSVRSADLS